MEWANTVLLNLFHVSAKEVLIIKKKSLSCDIKKIQQFFFACEPPCHPSIYITFRKIFLEKPLHTPHPPYIPSYPLHTLLPPTYPPPPYIPSYPLHTPHPPTYPPTPHPPRKKKFFQRIMLYEISANHDSSSFVKKQKNDLL